MTTPIFIEFIETKAQIICSWKRVGKKQPMIIAWFTESGLMNFHGNNKWIILSYMIRFFLSKYLFCSLSLSNPDGNLNQFSVLYCFTNNSSTFTGISIRITTYPMNFKTDLFRWNLSTLLNFVPFMFGSLRCFVYFFYANFWHRAFEKGFNISYSHAVPRQQASINHTIPLNHAVLWVSFTCTIVNLFSFHFFLVPLIAKQLSIKYNFNSWFINIYDEYLAHSKAS